MGSKWASALSKLFKVPVEHHVPTFALLEDNATKLHKAQEVPQMTLVYGALLFSANTTETGL
jgi:hypothetical protein